jgi:hypothetical protein
MGSTATILHADLDACYALVEQLRGGSALNNYVRNTQTAW